MKLEAAAITSPHRNQSDDFNSSLVSPKAPDTATRRINWSHRCRVVCYRSGPFLILSSPRRWWEMGFRSIR